jgi:hypothetical protein
VGRNFPADRHRAWLVISIQASALEKSAEAENADNIAMSKSHRACCSKSPVARWLNLRVIHLLLEEDNITLNNIT